MGKLLRYIAVTVLLSGILAAAVAMFAEPFFEKLFKRLGVDSSEWVDPMMSFFNQEYLSVIIASMIWFGIGVMSHWLAVRADIKPQTKEKKLRSLHRDLCEASDDLWGAMKSNGVYDFNKKSIVTDHKLNSLYYELNKLGIITPKIGAYSNKEHNFLHTLFLGNIKEYVGKGQIKLAKQAAKKTMSEFKAVRGQLQQQPDTQS